MLCANAANASAQAGRNPASGFLIRPASVALKHPTTLLRYRQQIQRPCREVVAAESPAIPVSQNLRRLMAYALPKGFRSWLYASFHISAIVRLFRSAAVARGTLRETRSQCQPDTNSIAADLCVQGFNAQRDQIPSRYVHLCIDSFKR